MFWVVTIIYLFFLTFILLYSLSLLNLTFIYIRQSKRKVDEVINTLVDHPIVTIQLPVYNEKYVILRLIEAVSKFDYPKNKMEIQLLDDSTDETIGIISEKVKELSEDGYLVTHIQRGNRDDFKAGALKYGLEICKGEYVAIFDADFVPEPDFLNKTIPHFSDIKIGVVQTRWGHINKDYSMLTQLQSYALNAHFSIEQTGRNTAGHFINFNGTAGVWRKTTIEESGGWQGDTITEDLDLSYRAQLKGWKFVYLENVVTPAELPADMNALKTQQFRWAKGAAECSRKNLGKVFLSKNVRFTTKLNAAFHLLNSFNWLCLFFSAILFLPFQYYLAKNPEMQHFFGFMYIYHIAFAVLLIYYFVSNQSTYGKSFSGSLKFLLSYPLFLSVSMGISLYNSLGVIQGYLGIKTSFVRTPKFNIVESTDNLRGKSYIDMKITTVTVIEFLAVIYFGFTVYYTFVTGNYIALPFTVMMTAGLSYVLFTSSLHYYQGKKVKLT